MKKHLLVVLAILLYCVPLSISAKPGISFSLNGIKTNSDIAYGLPIPSGADFSLEMPLREGKNSLTFRAAAGYESRMILRNAATSFPISAPARIDALNRFFCTNSLAELGFRHYMLKYENELAWIFAIIRGRYEKNATSFPTTLFSDAQSDESVSAVGGIAYDTTRWSEPNRKNGTYGEFSFEYSPTFAHFSGNPTEFARVNLTAETFIPLSPETRTLRNPSHIAPYLVLYGMGDYLAGSSIPHEALTSFGGLFGNDGIGDMVRGSQPWGYEATTKAYASAELRVAGASFKENLLVYPVGYLFADIAGYASLYGSPLSPSFADNAGVFASTGGGVSISMLNFLWLGAYSGWRWSIRDPLASIYYPSPQGFFWSFTFVAHY